MAVASFHIWLHQSQKTAKFYSNQTHILTFIIMIRLINENIEIFSKKNLNFINFENNCIRINQLIF